MLDEYNMSSNSATKTATQQSIKAYVDAQTTKEIKQVLSESVVEQALVFLEIVREKRRLN